MSSQDKAERTIKATPRRRQKAKEDGDLPRSREFPNILSLLAAVVLFFLFGGLAVLGLGRLVQRHLLRASTMAVTPETANNLFWESTGEVALIIGPLFIAVLVTALVFSMLFQGGWNVSFKVFRFKPSRFSLVSGFKKMLISKNAMVNLARTIVVVFIISYITWETLVEEMPHIPGLMMAPLPLAISYTAGFIFRALFKILFVLLIVAVMDLAWSRHTYEERLKMSRRDLKDEMKMTEGDPLIKRRIRTLQYQQTRKRMMAAVPTADVVITNPTHFAVAVAYDSEKLAPEVLAKGRDFLAKKIIEIAEEHNVPLVHNPGLAQTMYRLCEVGDMIPPELYRAVAEVLAYVYKLRHRFPEVDDSPPTQEHKG